MTAFDVQKALEDGRSARGGWNRAQLELIGVPWPPVKGWKATVIREGLKMTRAMYESFIALRTPD